MRRALRLLGAGLVAALVVGGRLTAQAPAGPTLTETQRLTLAVRVLAARNAALELALLVRELEQPGYRLDVEAGVYVADTKGTP